MQRVYGVMNHLSGLGPTNPADLKRKAEAYDVLRSTVGELVTHVLACLNFGDLTDAHEGLDAIELKLRITA